LKHSNNYFVAIISKRMIQGLGGLEGLNGLEIFQVGSSLLPPISRAYIATKN